MIDRGKQNLLGILINAIDYEATVEKIVSAAHQRRNLTVSALAVHGVMTGVLDAIHRYRLNHLDLVVPDGQPVRWALNGLHDCQLVDRVYGPTLMLKVCDRAARESLPIYLYGSKPEVLDALARNLQAKFPQLVVAGMQPSRFRQVSTSEKEEIAQQIRDSGAAIVFVGLGCPRQEVWVYEYRDFLPLPSIAVGAAFDFHAGLLSQAPSWMQRRGLEWLYRLSQEPGRLWKRYVYFNSLYLFLLGLQALRLKNFNPQQAISPTQEQMYG